jgi:aminomethyltransferase
MDVASGDGEPVGVVTSGTFSPILRKGIGLALLSATVSDGDEVYVDVRGRQEPFTVTKPPFITPDVGIA